MKNSIKLYFCELVYIIYLIIVILYYEGYEILIYGVLGLIVIKAYSNFMFAVLINYEERGRK